MKRSDLVRGAAGVSLGALLGPARALAGGGGGDYPAHPRWRFVFVTHQTLNPLLVATQFGAEDACALVECTMNWTGSPSGSVKETVSALQKAISGKADGIAVSVIDDEAFLPAVASAAKAGIPLVAFNEDADVSGRRFAYIGENPRISGARVGGEAARLVPGANVLLFAPKNADFRLERRLDGIFAGLSGASKSPSATVVRLTGDPHNQQNQIEAAYRSQRGVRGLFAVDGNGTVAVGAAINHLGLRGKVHAGGYDLLPDDLSLVADGTLDFVVDEQPYVQGFAPVMQLFLAQISQGTVSPTDTETSVLLRKADVATFLATKSRFEGSTSRHEYPLRHG
jgi:simple sugar transport system substrate-binding protein